MDPAGITSCNHSHGSIEPDFREAGSEQGGNYALQPIEEKPTDDARERREKHLYVWRRVIRNFTPSYADPFHHPILSELIY